MAAQASVPAQATVPPQAWSPRPYPQVLRGPRHRWWRPVLSLVVLCGAGLVLLLAVAVASLVLQLTGLVDIEAFIDPDDVGPGFLLANNLGLASLIPLVAIAVRFGHGWRPRWVSSVVGGLRWRWLLLVAAVSGAIQIAGTAVLFVWDGAPTGRGQDVALLLLVVALTTPLQAAGEEYLFRGWMAQSLGSVFGHAAVGAVVTGALSATLFALAHGQQDPYLFADRFAFGVLASALTWVTGGLEAAIAVHTMNNVVVFVPVILTGGLAGSLSTTGLGWPFLVADLVLMALTGAVVVRLARRRRLRRLHLPPPFPQPTSPPMPFSGQPGWPAPDWAPPPSSGSIDPR